MSNAFYDKLWVTSQKDATELLLLDHNIHDDNNKIGKTKDTAIKQILPVYLKYRNLVQRLLLIHGQMIQSQKRELIKKLLDCSIGRMLEFRREIVKLNCSEYEWPDELLIKMKWTPDDIEIPSSISYTSDCKDLLKQRRQYIKDLLEKATSPLEDSEKVVSNVELETIPSEMDLSRPSKIRRRKRLKTIVTSTIPHQRESLKDKTAREANEALRETFKNAILMIQNHERARFARTIGARAEKNYQYKRKLEWGEIQPNKVGKEVKQKAAITIQRFWRGYSVRRVMKKRAEDLEAVLGMIVPSWKDKFVLLKDQENLRLRQLRQPQSLVRIKEVSIAERAKIIETRGPKLIEDITTEIRAWFQQWYDKLGHLDVFPDPKIGGSIPVATGQTHTPSEYLLEKIAKQNATEQGKKNKENEGKEKGKKKEKNEPVEGWVMPESKVLEKLTEVDYEYSKNWKTRMEAGKFDKEAVHIDLIKDEICYELQLEIREIVDDLMRLEMDRLNEAIIKDHKNDAEKFVFPGMKKKKKNKGNKGKKKKQKKEEKSLEKEEIDEMFDELVVEGIIRNYPEINLNQWFGDLSYQNDQAKKDGRDYQHRLGDIKQAVIDYCVLPLGSKEAHSLAPLVRSVCIAGLPGTGKSFLSNAIASEVGALLFDLTPSVLAGKYEGKENEKKLLKMINTLARIYPPSIVLIDGGEKPWWKKIPPEEKETQPKRLAKLLPKFIKMIKPGDQILVLGLASEPWKAKSKFYKIYDKFIVIPISDYNSIFLFYKNILMKYHGINRNSDVSCLAKLSVGYSLNIIREAVENVLNLERRVTLKFKPLNPQEILKELMRLGKPPPKILDQFKKIESKTPLGKKRTKMLKAELEDQGNSSMKQSGKKK